MSLVLEQINSIGKAFVGFVLPMLVQSSVLILVLLLADLMLRKKVRAVFRYWMWVLALVQFVLPSFLPVPAKLSGWLRSEVPFGQAALLTWQGIFLLVWLAVLVGIVVFLFQRAISARRLVAQAKEANGLMKGVLWYCCTCMNVRRTIPLKVSIRVASPAVCGLFRPVILVPRNLAPSLGSRHLRAVLLHELAHIKRCDLWVNVAQTILQIIYFYNPLLWLANSIIRRVREQAVDETVVAAMGRRAKWYPETLVNVAKLGFKQPVLSLRMIGVVESKTALSGRIKHLFNQGVPKSAKSHILR